MRLEPIIRAKLARFRKIHELMNTPAGVAFERFANQMILTNHQPDAFSVEGDLLNAVCVGGTNDMGLDGLCIKLNGILVRTVQEAKDILSLHKKADIEFIFVQSKYKDKFDSGEYAKFINGVTDFLGEDHFQPCNQQIEAWLAIKDYLMSDDIMLNWLHNPDVRLYYVVMGTWNDSLHITAISKQFDQNIANLNNYGNIAIKYVDSDAFKRICDENENTFSTVLNVIDTFSLTAVDEVDNSTIILFSAEELLSMLISDDGIIRKSLFNDNVRDYQGDTSINSEILHTVSTDPQSFVLLNNGITIVCDAIIPGNRKITIRNPQIVNGCQTCNVIYKAYKTGVNISEVVVTAKIISTRSDDITNRIVKGTNRQNIVYDEAFEITRGFHKELEEFFAALSAENPEAKLFYERRSKQFIDNPAITPAQKVNFRILIQSFVSIFLYVPHQGHRHEAKLLQEYKNMIFIDSQSKYPYYTGARLYAFVEKMMKNEVVPKKLGTYRMHLALILSVLVAGRAPNINREKDIDQYCEKLLRVLKEENEWSAQVNRAINVFEMAEADWIAKKGESYKYGIKDSSEFTEFLLRRLFTAPDSTSLIEQPLQCRGIVVKVGWDRNGERFGFISKSPENIFFHSRENPDLDYEALAGRSVLYTTTIDRFHGREKAVNIGII